MKRGGPTHPKTYDLAERLGVRRPHAVGILELLFHFAAQYAPEGDVGRFSDKRIAAAVDWGGSPTKLVSAMVDAGWLDPHPAARLVLHGWAEHADHTTLQKLHRAGKKPIESNHVDTAKACDQIETTGSTLIALPLPLPEPEPLPEPHTHTERAVSVTDMDGITSQLFEEIWNQWPRKSGRDLACQNWISFVTTANESTVMACADRYLASDEVSRNVVMNLSRWLEQQHRDGWAGDWPRRRPPLGELIQAAVRGIAPEKPESIVGHRTG